VDIPDPNVYLAPFLGALWIIFKSWWWLIVPAVFFIPARALYLWWIQWEIWYKEQEWAVLEVIPPADILKPYRAMEDIYNATWSIIDSPNWRELWCEGELENFPYWWSFELVSIEGQLHYYFRIPKDTKKLFEAIFHTHYAGAEIFEVPDYTKEVPQNLPNKDYEVYGEDYILLRDDIYPIKTYDFFEIRPEEIEKEKKLDPFVQLLEALSKLKKGERSWIQMIITPISDENIPWVTHGKEEINKLAHRPAKTPAPSLVGEAARLVLFNKVPYSDPVKEESLIPPEMRLTPGERDTIASIEKKVSKIGFKTSIRAMYIYEKGCRVAPHGRIFRAYCLHFNTQNANGMRYFKSTRTKIHYIFRKRRLYNRKKEMFSRYIRRFPSSYPKLYGKGSMILNAEELATLFHFPASSVELPAGVPRIMAKKFTAPPAIPTEEN
jgi:hypothetical protein